MMKEASKAIDYPQEIKDELHSRVHAFFGEDGFKILQSSFVIVSESTFIYCISKDSEEVIVSNRFIPVCVTRLLGSAV